MDGPRCFLHVLSHILDGGYWNRWSHITETESTPVSGVKGLNLFTRRMRFTESDGKFTVFEWQNLEAIVVFRFFCLMLLHAVPVFESQVYHMGKFSIYRTPGLPRGTRHFAYDSLVTGWLEYVVLLMEEILHQLRGSLAYYLQGFIHHRWCRISSINSKLWHLLSQCVSTSCVSRLSTLLPLGLWHSARPVVYGIVGRVSRTPTAIVLSRTCPDHVSKSAIWQFRQEIV